MKLRFILFASLLLFPVLSSNAQSGTNKLFEHDISIGELPDIASAGTFVLSNPYSNSVIVGFSLNGNDWSYDTIAPMKNQTFALDNDKWVYALMRSNHPDGEKMAKYTLYSKLRYQINYDLDKEQYLINQLNAITK